ncbi:hypothetical protein SNE40_021076 [Patella caerulea]|uniref:Uncharacterized protein n=1 Tax=Patella caerulea TaxID=87958 RepID=A0AAN8IXW4_PATCE
MHRLSKAVCEKTVELDARCMKEKVDEVKAINAKGGAIRCEDSNSSTGKSKSSAVNTINDNLWAFLICQIRSGHLERRMPYLTLAVRRNFTEKNRFFSV